MRVLRVFLLLAACGGVLLACAGGTPAANDRPRVLAIRFGPDLEINPVTQDWFNHQLDEAAKKGYDAPTGLGTPDGPGGL